MSTVRSENLAGVPLAKDADKTKRYIIEVSRKQDEWVPVHLVLPFRSSYGWKKDEAYRMERIIRNTVRPISQGFIKIRVREEDTTKPKVEVPKPEENSARKRPRRKRVQRDTSQGT